MCELRARKWIRQVWDERYFVLTRKGLHYYVRQQGSGNSNRRDLFGEHEGSIALGNIARVELGEKFPREMTFVIVSKGGGRHYVLQASTAELHQRWVATLQAAIAPPAAGGGLNGSSNGRSGSGSAGRLGSLRSSSSFPRIPTLLDFRLPPRTDNLLNITFYSDALGLFLARRHSVLSFWYLALRIVMLCRVCFSHCLAWAHTRTAVPLL